LSADIEAQWQLFKLASKDKLGEENRNESDDEASDGEGSTYDTSSEDEAVQKTKKNSKRELQKFQPKTKTEKTARVVWTYNAKTGGQKCNCRSV
jgi:hypothetical protein